MFYSFSVLLFHLFILVDGCKWIEDMQDVSTKIELSGSGLHRTLHVNGRIASISRFTECKLLFEVVIPKGAYVDLDSINSSLPLPFLYSPHHFDVEAPAAKSKEHTIYVSPKKTFRKTFLIENKLDLPVHLRYHPAAEVSGSSATVEFPSPSLLLDCGDDYKVQQLQNCAGRQRILKPFGVPTNSPAWIALPAIKQRVYPSAVVPVGDKSKTNTVLYGTVGALVGCLLYIIVARTLLKSKSE